MTDYVVGDIQGCYAGLNKLLDTLSFNPQHDKLIAVGDLIARGEDSLSVLKLCRSFGDRFTSVLGNHDLHLLVTQAGLKTAKEADRLDRLLNNKRLNRYIDWLRQFPLAYQYDPNTLITHAGLYPGWSFSQALQYSHEIETILQQKKFAESINALYGNRPHCWHSNLSGKDRKRFIINAFTRMRYISLNGGLDLKSKMSPTNAPDDIEPWFKKHNPHLSPQQRVIFGHWASLDGLTQHPQFIALDTGYVWGKKLTALNLTENKLISVSAEN